MATAPATPVDVTYNGITWTLSHDAPRTTDAVGVPIIQAVQGLQVTQRTSPYQSGSRTINGTMKNPVRDAAQGIDSAMLTFSSGAVETFPIDVAAGDIVAGRLSDTSGTYNRRRGTGTDSYLCFVSSLPTAGAGQALFAPAAMGWSGRGTPAVRSIDVDAFIAAHTTVDGTSLPLPSAAQILGAIGQPIAFGARTDRDVEAGYEAHLPLGWGGSDTNYGQYSAGMLAAATAALYTNNRYSTADRRRIAEWLIHASIAIVDPILGSGPGAAFYNGGGHAQWQAALFIVAAKALGDDTILSGIGTSFPNSLTEQPFVMTQALLDRCVPHDNASDPFTYARRTPSAVSGNTITFPGRYVNGSPFDPTWLDCDGLELVRESDGVTAAILSTSNINLRVGAGGTWDLTIDAQPASPFTTSDVLYLRPVVPLALGEIYWTLTGTNSFSQFNPSPGATYVALFNPSATILYLYASQMGVASAGVLDTARDWTIQNHAQDFPSANLPYPPPHTTAKLGSTDFSVGSAIWNAEAHNLVPGAPAPNFSAESLFQPGDVGVAFVPSTSTAYQDTAGTIPASHGQNVGRLIDLGPNALHALQGTTSAQAELREDGGLSWMQLTHNITRMATPTIDFSASTELTVAITFEASSLYDFQVLFAMDGVSAGDPGRFRMFASGGDCVMSIADNAGVRSGPRSAFTRNVATVAIMRINLATGERIIETTSAGSGTNTDSVPWSNHPAAFSPDVLYLFGSDTPGGWSHPRMYGMAVVDRWIDGAELIDLREYFAGLAGIALP